MKIKKGRVTIVLTFVGVLLIFGAAIIQAQSINRSYQEEITKNQLLSHELSESNQKVMDLEHQLQELEAIHKNCPK